MKIGFSKVLVGAAVAMGLAISALPANAGTLTWVDKEGDAQLEVEPSEASLDILKVTLSSDAQNLVWKMNMKALAGSPSASLGYHFQLDFVIGESKFNLRLTDDPSNKNVRLRADNAGTVTQVVCDKCKGEVKREAKEVTASVPLAELAKLSKTAFPSAPPVGPGSEMSGLLANAYRSYAAAYLRMDDAPAPDGSSFVI